MCKKKKEKVTVLGVFFAVGAGNDEKIILLWR